MIELFEYRGKFKDLFVEGPDSDGEISFQIESFDGLETVFLPTSAAGELHEVLGKMLGRE